jgi:hypothetical protein
MSMDTGISRAAARDRVASNETLQNAIRIDPRIGRVFEEVLKIQPRQDGYDRYRAYGIYKNVLYHMVGWGALLPELGESRYWDAAVITLFDILPNDAGDAESDEIDADGMGEPSQWNWRAN